MKAFPRSAFVVFTAIFLVAVSVSSFGQNAPPQLAATNPGYVKMPSVNINSVKLPSSSIRLVMPKGATSTRGRIVNDANSSGNAGGTNGASHRGGVQNPVPNIVGLDTVPTFTGTFNSIAPSIDPLQSPDGFTTTSSFIMMGNSPLVGGTTVIPANISEVSLQLLKPDGSVFANVPFAPFEDVFEDSPNFRDAQYSVGRTQFGDAVQRAEFFNVMGPDWHTLLNPSIVNRAVIQVPATVQVQFSDGTIITVPGYIPRKASDGSTVVFMLDALFSALDDNQVVNDIVSGAFTTNAFNYHAYPNTFLFSVEESKPQGPFPCCVAGFHTFFFDPTVHPESRWIYAFTPWISPGIFGGGFQDVTALSHETSEAFNDPFIFNIVPTWQFPGVPANDNVDCQANLETGDPVEVLPNSTVPIVTREGNEVFQYHPQTEALLQWFEIGNPSTAIGGAFSYPNTAALTTAAKPCPM